MIGADPQQTAAAHLLRRWRSTWRRGRTRDHVDGLLQVGSLSVQATAGLI